MAVVKNRFGSINNFIIMYNSIHNTEVAYNPYYRTKETRLSISNKLKKGNIKND